ncbi:MAG TPA: hypothetical protein VK469_22915 [Candidatus Kapabacteria bacterium]|nr:hypothetical protein [Candidatus Kapabacteria bacterium]
MNDKIKEIKQAIINKKNQINQIYKEQLIPEIEELKQLMNSAAKEICPFKVGDRIEFEDGKQGEITDITYFSLDFNYYCYIPPVTKRGYEEAETFDYSQAVVIDYNHEKFSFTWQLEGVMINKDGNPGKRKFVPKNLFENKIEGNKVFEKTLSKVLGLDEFIDT